jgi:hypothetical protein
MVLNKKMEITTSSLEQEQEYINARIKKLKRAGFYNISVVINKDKIFRNYYTGEFWKPAHLESKQIFEQQTPLKKIRQWRQEKREYLVRYGLKQRTYYVDGSTWFIDKDGYTIRFESSCDRSYELFYLKKFWFLTNLTEVPEKQTKLRFKNSSNKTLRQLFLEAQQQQSNDRHQQTNDRINTGATV